MTYELIFKVQPKYLPFLRVHIIEMKYQGLHDIAEHLNEASFVIKEGAAYRIRFDFHVQREICTGLKYIQKVTRHSITGVEISYFAQIC